MSPTAVEVGKMEIFNLNLDKQFILLRKVITEHRYKTLHENLIVETTKT